MSSVYRKKQKHTNKRYIKKTTDPAISVLSEMIKNMSYPES